VIMGTQELERQLAGKGYKTWSYKNNFIAFKMIVPHGRFRGLEVEIALQAPQFPQVPPSGPHIKPHLLPFNPSGQTHPFDGIHDRKVPTSEFQYWSRPFKGWNKSKMNVDEYLAFLRTLFDFE
jgi:hypothetical protein